MDTIKEAFQNVKRDIEFLNQELLSLKEEMRETRREMLKICEIIEQITLKISQKPLITNPTHQQINQTISTHNPTHTSLFKPLKPQILRFSSGNEGVPTDRQTDRQTDNNGQNYPKQPIFPYSLHIKNPIEDAAKMLDSLDSLKKEIRLKFKQLTDQEILVFSTLYQLEEETGPVDYKTLADRLKLTESSIRDYIGRLLKKGIPVEKNKINNKQIQLSISQNLKKIASLPTILKLRGI